MILINIITDKMKKAIEIVDFLTAKKLILDTVIAKDVVMRKKADNTMISEKRILIIGKTKSLLFDTIDGLLRDKYKSLMPILYSVPIVQMDWEQANELVKKTAKI